MGFDDDLARHLDAISRRDLDALADTVDPDDVVLVTAKGEVVLGRDAFLDLHRDWFASDTWTIETQPVRVREGADLATAVLRIRYRDRDIDERSVLSLVFRSRGDRWLMVQDQNTPTV